MNYLNYEKKIVEQYGIELTVSPSKHAVKLPYWSEEWYRRYHREVARHMYVSYIASVMSRLALHAVPRFGSEATPNVCFFTNQSHNP